MLLAMPEPGVLLRPQTDLLDRAGRYLAGGGLGLFVLPDEVNLVIPDRKSGLEVRRVLFRSRGSMAEIFNSSFFEPRKGASVAKRRGRIRYAAGHARTRCASTSAN